MKKILSISLAALAFIAVSCDKANTDLNPGQPKDNQENVKPAGEQITITATLSDALTKVTFDPQFDGSNKPTGMAHTWEDGDKLLVVDASNDTNFQEFILLDGAGTDTGVFTGTSIEAASFNVTVIPKSSPSSLEPTQTQLEDGSTAHLKFVAGATGVTDLKNFVLDETSNIIGFIAKLPAGATETITQVEIVKSPDDFVTTSTLTINLGSATDANDDDILEVYANVPSGWAITAGTKMFLRFKDTAPSASHTVYTRYQEFASAATIKAGKFNYIKMNCSNIDKYAGGADNGSATAPYLIADGYQLAAINSYASTSEKKYFKMIADVDMTGITHTSINDGISGYTIAVDFDGNNKTISNLGKCLFYVFKGSAYDFTLDNSVVTNRGIFAEYCQGSGHEISNVTITNGEVTSSSSNVGGLIGQINSGTSGIITATITNCTVSGTDVTGAGVVGGFIGFANELVSISGCKYTGGTVTASAKYCGGFVGSTANMASVISDCQVEDATVKSTCTDDARCGGFVGQTQTSVQIKGCTVGTDAQKVVVNTAKPASGKVLNAGGFVGVNYGTITMNGSVRSKAYVQVKSANDQGQPINVGGFVGFHRGTIEYCDAVVDMSDLQGQYIGGFAGYSVNDGTVARHNTVLGSVKGNNYTGGFVGYVDNNSITFSDNQVLAGSTVNGQSAVGGFAGYTVSGTYSDNTVAGTVTVRANNGGGFVGTTEGGSFTDCSTSADVTGNGTVIGGFVGNGVVANMTRCSSSGAVVKNSSNGNQVGGFAGIIDTCTLNGCYATGSVTTTAITAEYVGGFIGNLKPATDALASIQNCYATGTVNGSGRWTGGFIGYIYRAADNCGSVEISKCYATGNVAVTGKSYVAGFIGRTYMVAGTHLTIEKCYATGNVTSNQSAASAFIGEIGEATTCTISDCYSTGNIIGANQQRGGLIAIVNANANTSATISRCYSTSSLSDGSFRLGGLIGNIAGTNCSMDHCAAWNGAVVATAYSYNKNWSSGTIVGTAHPNCILTDNYRKPDMTTTMWWVPDSDYNHPNVEGTTHPLVIRNNEEPYTYTEATVTSLGAPYQFPYHGKVEAGKTLSQLASTTLGWDSTVWDFTGDLPTLK